jgi:hypothetical protein
MKKFLAVYTGSRTSVQGRAWDAMDETMRSARAAAGMSAWGDWMTAHQASLVEAGGPLGKTKQASMQGVADISNNLSGFTIVQAESHEEAAKLFEKHPHFSIFPGESVEIMEILPIPTK